MKNTLLLCILSAVLLTACQVNSIQDAKDDQFDESGKSGGDRRRPVVDAKYSLAKDRAELDKLRQTIPPDVRKQNDEKAFLAELMGEVKYPPEVVREKFSNLVRKKREVFNRDMTKLREDFNKNEKKNRESFTKDLTEERDSFLKRKVEREKRADFFNEQDEARRTFSAEQKEKRDEFEADIREKRKNFDDYMKEKTDDFAFELKNYQALWQEKQEHQKLEKDLKK